MDDLECPRCKTTRYRNPSLKLMVNVCGHSLCEGCIEMLFIRGSGACPQCGTALRRNNFRLQLFEDPSVEKEVDIRKRILKDFNKKEEDFDNLNDYNDYLEMVETIVFNLANDVDVESTRRQIEEYKRENQAQIKKNRSKLSKDEEYLEELIEMEKAEAEFMRHQFMEEELKEQNEKKKNKEALIDELMFSDLPADHILASHRQEVEAQQQEKSAVPAQDRRTAFSTGIRVGKQEGFLSIPKKDEGVLFNYAAPEVERIGPTPPDDEQLLNSGYLSYIREATDQELGGGYIAHIGCQRALQDAFCGLFYNKDMLQQLGARSLTPVDVDMMR